MRNRLPAVNLALALIFAGTLLAPSPADARGLTPWDVARLQAVRSAAVSPDGQYVAWTLGVPRQPMVDENGPDWSELHVYDVQDATNRPFVTGEVSVSSVRWTPDSSHIAFLAKRGDDEKTALWVIGVRGGEARKLIAHDEDIKEFAFNSDGSRVVFLAPESKTDRQKELEEQGFDMEVYEEDPTNNLMFVADVDLDDYRARGATEYRQIELDGHPSDLRYRPGHEQVLVAMAPDSRIDLRYVDRRLTLVDLGSGEIVGRIESEGKLGEAEFSPDGERVAFIGAVDIHDPAEGQLMVAPATGGTPVNLMPDLPAHINDIGWKNDDTVVFLADVGVHTAVGEIAATGGEPPVLGPSETPAGSWEDLGVNPTVVTQISVSDDGTRMAFVGESAMHPAELFFGPTGRTPERVTFHNSWLDDIDLGTQAVHEWTTRDDLDLQGVLIYPVGYEEGRRYPLIAVIHGGPESHERNGWKTRYSRPGQYMATEGYFVWYPNYRGSTGRGHAFTLTSQGDPGGKEFDDIVDGVEDLIARGLVERGKVGITGGSYGGFASAWGATALSEHFQASVMFVGISEQYSKFGTTDIPLESQLVHQNPRKVYDDWQFFLERSPIYHARGSRTPLLILHGKDDPRVHPTQSMIMYRYFEHLAEAPVRLVWYPGEGHGNRKAAGKLDYSLRLMRWMNHFLVEGGDEKPPFEIDYEEPAPEGTPGR